MTRLRFRMLRRHHGPFTEQLALCLALLLALSACSVALAAGDEFKEMDLAGKWRYNPEHEEELSAPGLADAAWREVDVPGPLTGQGLPNGNGWYRCRFTLAKEAAGRDLVLDAMRINGACWVYVGGRLVGWSAGRTRRGAFLIPAQVLKEGENVLAIKVVSRNGIEAGNPRLRLPNGARDETRQILFDYLRRSAVFEVGVPPLAAGGEVPVSLSLVMHERANPLLDGAQLAFALETEQQEGDKPNAEWVELVTRQAKLTVGDKIAAQFQWKAEDARPCRLVVRCLDGEAVTRELVAHNVLGLALPRLLADARSRALTDEKGRLASLFVGAVPKFQKAQREHARPVVVGLLSSMLWDDYYLPRNRDDNFVAQFCQHLPGGADYVDASFRGLPLLALCELDRSVLAAEPDIIVISLGEHEHFCSPSVAECAAAVNAIVDRLRAHTTAELVFVTPPPSLKAAEIGAPYEEMMRATARRVKARVIDAGKLFARAEGGLEANYDRLAPNVRLHALLADELVKMFPAKGVKRVCSREEYVRPTSAPESDKTLALIEDEKWPATSGASGNRVWEDVAGKRYHTHKANDKQTEHNVTGHPCGFGILYHTPPVSSEDKPSPQTDAGASVTLEQEILIPQDSAVTSLMLVLQSAQVNRDAQGINYLHRHSWDHGVYWGEDLIRYGKGRKSGAHVRGGDLPGKGKPIVLSVSAKSLGLPGRVLLGARFVTFGGPVLWGETVLVERDQSGKKVTQRQPVPFTVTAGRGMDWQLAPLPGGKAGAWGQRRCHRTIDPANVRRYGVRFKTAVPLAPGARLRQWVYLPPQERPDRIGLLVDGRTVHYWGRLMVYDGREVSLWRYAGAMPTPGRWTLLELDLGGAPRARLTQVQFFTQTGAALWGKTEIVGVAEGFAPPDDFVVTYPTGPNDVWATVSTDRMGNQFFEGQKPKLALHLNNTGQAAQMKAAVELRDAYGKTLATMPIAVNVPAQSVQRVPLKCPDLPRGFYRAIVRDAQGRVVHETSLSMLPRHVNFRDKQVFVYSNSGYVWEQLRFFDVLGGKWCRYIAPQQETHRIECFDTSRVDGITPGTQTVMEAYRAAVANARRKKSTEHHVQYWFNISSDEMNLKWHNYERWSEVIKAVTVGLKQADPNCLVGTPEVNSIALGMVDKLGENRTYDYLDIFFSTGCSLPVPPECMNKYWSFDLESLDTIQERYGRTITMTGMQYSTGNIGRAWGIGERHQATYYVRGDVMRRARGIDYISYFKFRESQNVNLYEVKDAITHADLTPKPAFVALCNNFALLDGARYLGRLRLGRGAHAYLFDRPAPHGMVLVLWSTEPVPQRAYLNLHAEAVRVVNLFGGTSELDTRDGLAAIEYGGDVLYIEGVGGEITEETFFEAAPVRDKRGIALKSPSPVFACIEHSRVDSLNFGASRRGGRGDFLLTTGGAAKVRVNVYNLSASAGTARVRLDVPRGLTCEKDAQTFALKAGACASHTFNVAVPLDATPGLGKFVLSGEFHGKAGAVRLDPFASDVLVRSPLEVLPAEGALPFGGKATAPAKLKVAFRNAADGPVDANVRVEVPFGWKLKTDAAALKAVPAGGEAVAEFEVLGAKAVPLHEYRVAAFAQVGKATAATESALDFALAMQCAAPPVLDGEMDDWDESAPLFGGQRCNDYIYNQLSEILDKENFSLRLRTMWDEKNLYLAFDVWDDHLCCEDTKHGLLWDLDSLQINFDADGDGKRDERVSISPTGRSYITPDDPRGDREPMITGSKGLVEVATKVYHHPTPKRAAGYAAEMAIPWEWFGKGLRPAAGGKFGLHLFAVDEDPQGWSARPWKFDEGRKPTFVPFTFAGPSLPAHLAARRRSVLERKAFRRSVGDLAAFKVGEEAGLVFGPYTAGNAERFPTTGLDHAERAKAGRLWFYGPGWVEYEFEVGGTVASATKKGARLRAVEVAAELASCYRPGNTHYAVPGNPTRVTVSVGGLEIGRFDALGDPGVDGYLMRLRVTEGGTFHRERRISQVNLDEVLPKLTGKVRVRLSAEGMGGSVGGLNVHGPSGSGIHGVAPSLIVECERDAQ